MSPTDEVGKLLEFKPVVKRGRPGSCHHAHFTVSETEAKLTCRDCEAPIDPWWALRKIAVEHENISYRLRAARDETQKLIEQVVELRRQKANLKSQVRRASMKMKSVPKETR
jgi:hypothetical protein